MRTVYTTIILTALMAASCHGCPTNSSPQSELLGDSAARRDAGVQASVIEWARGRATAIVQTDDAVVALAVDSGERRVLYAGSALGVILDPSLNLLWVQTQGSLRVIDLEERAGATTLIATGLPENVPIQIVHEIGERRVLLAAPNVCIQPDELRLEWTVTPRLDFVKSSTSEGGAVVAQPVLVGLAWLSEQLTRVHSKYTISRRDFVTGPASSIAEWPARRLACARSELCARAIPFDVRGRLLVMTDYFEGDCQHYGCRLYNPASRRLLPLPTAEGYLESSGSGACGLYHFDHSGERYLIGEVMCTLDDKCQRLGGTAIGWLSGGTDVGTDG